MVNTLMRQILHTILCMSMWVCFMERGSTQFFVHLAKGNKTVLWQKVSSQEGEQQFMSRFRGVSSNLPCSSQGPGVQIFWRWEAATNHILCSLHLSLADVLAYQPVMDKVRMGVWEWTSIVFGRLNICCTSLRYRCSAPSWGPRCWLRPGNGRTNRGH